MRLLRPNGSARRICEEVPFVVVRRGPRIEQRYSGRCSWRAEGINGGPHSASAKWVLTDVIITLTATTYVHTARVSNEQGADCCSSRLEPSRRTAGSNLDRPWGPGRQCWLRACDRQAHCGKAAGSDLDVVIYAETRVAS
jgi:hypothetical protein